LPLAVLACTHRHNSILRMSPVDTPGYSTPFAPRYQDFHHRLLGSMETLASAYSSAGKFVEAQQLDEQAFEISRRTQGKEDRTTLSAMTSLAFDYWSLGNFDSALALCHEALEIQKRVLGPQDPDTLTTLSTLALIYQRQKKYDLAQTYASQALEGQRHVLGQRLPTTLNAEADLGLAYESLGKFTQSEPLAHEALTIDREVQPRDWQGYRAESLLGASLAGQKKFAEAEPLLLEGYQGMLTRIHQMAVPDRYHLDLARKWIIQLYQDWGKPEKAGEWKRK